MQLKNLNSGAEVIANYKAVRERVNNWRPPPPKPEPFPIHLFIEPPKPIPVKTEDITMARIRQVVCSYYYLTSAELVSHIRAFRLIRPRQIAMWLCCKLIPAPNNSTPKIGRDFGGRDHSTIIYSRDKIEGLIETNPQLAEEIAALRKIIEGS